jgi:hypothetical protein
MDGSYIADGRTVKRKPTKTERGLTMGFVICNLADDVGDEAAQEIADALNLHRQHHPEKH